VASTVVLEAMLAQIGLQSKTTTVQVKVTGAENATETGSADDDGPLRRCLIARSFYFLSVWCHSSAPFIP
jgi:hypothetical protein